MACTAILAALADAGLTVADLDGFTIYSNAVDPAQVASVLGVPEVRFAASLTSGGGGSAGSSASDLLPACRGRKASSGPHRCAANRPCQSWSN